MSYKHMGIDMGICDSWLYTQEVYFVVPLVWGIIDLEDPIPNTGKQLSSSTGGPRHHAWVRVLHALPYSCYRPRGLPHCPCAGWETRPGPIANVVTKDPPQYCLLGDHLGHTIPLSHG